MISKNNNDNNDNNNHSDALNDHSANGYQPPTYFLPLCCHAHKNDITIGFSCLMLRVHAITKASDYVGRENVAAMLTTI